MIRATLVVAALLLWCAPAQATPRCFGAASRDPEVPCHNPRLSTMVTPTPNQALITPNAVCARSVEQALEDCSYGAKNPDVTVALLGDSHGAHWRGALKWAANHARWRVDEFAAPHCWFSTAVPDTTPDYQQKCADLNDQVIAWLDNHPEVGTVFVSASTHAPVVAQPGETTFDTRVRGFLEEWDQLPTSVQRIVVLRDDPGDEVDTFDCVRRAMRRHRNAGNACRVNRRAALRRDAEVVAAEESDRVVDVVDFTPQFCGTRFCFPVVGGVLVHKDRDHVGQLFARTLGPILLRRVRFLVGDGVYA